MPIPNWLKRKPGALYLVGPNGRQGVVRGSQKHLQDMAAALKTVGYTGIRNDPETFDVYTLQRNTFTRVPDFRDHWKHNQDWLPFHVGQLDMFSGADGKEANEPE